MVVNKCHSDRLDLNIRMHKCVNTIVSMGILVLICFFNCQANESTANFILKVGIGSLVCAPVCFDTGC